MHPSGKKIVFYDGDCGFCNRSVDFILRHEKDQELFFASLQSTFTKNFLRDKGLPEPELDTIIFFDGTDFLKRSDAALEIAGHLKSPHSWLRLFKWIPTAARDAVYKLIARNRKKLGKFKCAVPDAAQRKRFLDLI